MVLFRGIERSLRSEEQRVKRLKQGEITDKWGREQNDRKGFIGPER